MVQQKSITQSSIEDHLASSIQKSALLRHLDLSVQVQQYIANMLRSFIRTGDLFSRKTVEGKLQLEPVSYQYFQALSEKGVIRNLQLRRVADECLFLTGYFYDFLTSAGKGQVQFHQDIGISAYTHLAEGNNYRHSPVPIVGGAYGELATHFTVLSTILGDLHLPELDNPKNLLRLYERWRQVGDERQKDLLVAQGFLGKKNNKLN